MTPERAQEIYHEGCNVEYRKHQDNYTPVNQNKVTLAGFQAVIDAAKAEATAEVDNEYARKLLAQSYDFTGQRGPLAASAAQVAAESGERSN